MIGENNAAVFKTESKGQVIWVIHKQIKKKNPGGRETFADSHKQLSVNQLGHIKWSHTKLVCWQSRSISQDPANNRKFHFLLFAYVNTKWLKGVLDNCTYCMCQLMSLALQQSWTERNRWMKHFLLVKLNGKLDGFYRRTDKTRAA